MSPEVDLKNDTLRDVTTAVMLTNRRVMVMVRVRVRVELGLWLGLGLGLGRLRVSVWIRAN